MLCANVNTESVCEKTVGEKMVDTDELSPVESLLNHMDLDDEISIIVQLIQRLEKECGGGLNVPLPT